VTGKFAPVTRAFCHHAERNNRQLTGGPEALQASGSGSAPAGAEWPGKSPGTVSRRKSRSGFSCRDL